MRVTRRRKTPSKREHKNHTDDDGPKLYERAVSAHFKCRVVAASTFIEHTHAIAPSARADTYSELSAYRATH